MRGFRAAITTLTGAAFFVASPAASAQTIVAQRPDEISLITRMRDFQAAVVNGQLAEIVRFFPRSGTWTWIRTGYPRAVDGKFGVWTFPGDQTARALTPGGPLCLSFAGIQDNVGPDERSFRMRMLFHSKQWAHAGGSRFVPPDEAATSATFIEWRFEDGEWVVAVMGDEYHANLPTGRSFGLNIVRRVQGTANSPFDAAAAQNVSPDTINWYRAHEPIFFRGQYFLKFGRPLQLGLDEVVRFGSLNGVPIFIEANISSERPAVLYARVNEREFQPY